MSNVRKGSGARTWTAACAGEIYSCSQVTTSGWGPNAGATQVSCSPMGGGRASARSARATRDPVATAHGEGGAEVKRGYDEERHAHFVTGKFGVAPGLNVIVSGAPKLSMGAISVTLSGVSRVPAVRQCPGLEVLINGEPVATDRNEATPGVGNVKIESRFDFAVFRPLSGRFPVFGVCACGTSWSFTPHQLERLRALFVVYSDLATELQNNPDANAPAAPGQTSL